MVPSTNSLMKFMIYFIFLWTFIHSLPLVDVINEDQNRAENSLLNNYLGGSSRYVRNSPYGFDIPENLYNHHRQQQQLFYQNKQFNPDNVQLAKRIIMLPRVGRRSVRST